MPQKTLGGIAVDVDDEGYMTNRTQWNRSVATALAAEEGITLTDAHWKVLEFIDKDFREKGVVPGMLWMNKIGNIPTKNCMRSSQMDRSKRRLKLAAIPNRQAASNGKRST